MISLKRTLEVQTSSYKNKNMLKYVKTELKRMGASYYQDKRGSIYATKGVGKSYGCVVAHTDTVHRIVPRKSFKIYTEKNIMFSIDTRDWTRTGIGGDDKVGVYVALRMMEELDVLKAAFFVDEEVGCVGSGDADLKFFGDVRLCMQADRKGFREITNSIHMTEMYGDVFANDIEPVLKKWNVVEVDGGMTDVCTLADKIDNIPMFNAACGYYKPHTANEYVDVSEVEDTYLFMKEVMVCTDGVDYRAEYKREAYTYSNNWGNWDSTRDWTPSNNVSQKTVWTTNRNWKSKEPNVEVCPSCHTENLHRDWGEDYICHSCGYYGSKDPYAS